MLFNFTLSRASIFHSASLRSFKLYVISVSLLAFHKTKWNFISENFNQYEGHECICMFAFWLREFFFPKNNAFVIMEQ